MVFQNMFLHPAFDMYAAPTKKVYTILNAEFLKKVSRLLFDFKLPNVAWIMDFSRLDRELFETLLQTLETKNNARLIELRICSKDL
jgi:hypothetical protein